MTNATEQTRPETITITGPESWSQLAPSRAYFRRVESSPAPSPELPRNQILLGDAATMLRTLPRASVDCVVTSPPFFLLRNYQAENQIGLEANVGEYVRHIVAVMDEVARVLKPTGSVWLNLGDSYSRSEGYGAVPKAMLLAPERVLIALSERGWIVRNKVVWAKPNPMPTSVADRLNTTWEPLYFLVRSPTYSFDLDAIREPHRSTRRPSVPSPTIKYRPGGKQSWAGPLAGANDGLLRLRLQGLPGNPRGKNPGDVWQLPTASYHGAHFATFPTRLLTKPLLATCPKRICEGCGAPWKHEKNSLVADCTCRALARPGVVLDCFMGAGTTALEAERLGRDWIGIEVNAEYRDLALERVAAARPKRAKA